MVKNSCKLNLNLSTDYCKDYVICVFSHVKHRLRGVCTLGEVLYIHVTPMILHMQWQLHERTLLSTMFCGNYQLLAH
jgi:hypothetical protein